MTENINKEYKFKGTIIEIGPMQRVSEKFIKREFVVSDKSARYPQTILFQATQDRCDLLDSHIVGGLVEVSFNLNGRQWTSKEGQVKTFNTLDAWKITKVQIDKVSITEQTPTIASQSEAQETNSNDNDPPF